MGSDISRSTFKPEKHYNSVRMQQGRVALDSDWNEQSDLVQHVERTTDRDVIGPCGAPIEGGGFAVAPTGDGKDLLLSPGHIYVDGILCELDLQAVPITFVTGHANQVVPAIWAPDSLAFAAGQWIEIFDGSDASQPAQLLQVITADATKGVLTLNNPVNAKLLKADVPELRRQVTYNSQPDNPPPLPAPTAGLNLVYVDVWERTITALEDPAIREVALGGPDTTTRKKTLWQVNLWPVPATIKSPSCSSVAGSDEWEKFIAPGSARLAARAVPGQDASTPCVVPQQAGYRRLENQLYRVEIQTGGNAKKATFKWSRENGSVTTAWLGKQGNDLSVKSLGRDQTLGFGSGQWLELTDDTHELAGIPGVLVRATDAKIGNDGPVITIDPNTASNPANLDFSKFPLNPKVRRWDQTDANQVSVPGGDIPIQEGKWLDLEGGVQVFFQAGGSYQPGDYWLIPARTVTGDVEWPRDDSSDALFLPPKGIRHHYCSLALAQLTNGLWSVVSDCRQLFPSTTDLTSLFYVSGDGQEALPDPTQPQKLFPLDNPLIVGVANGQWPVNNRKVRFAVTLGKGKLQGGVTSADVVTATLNGVDGLASCTWSLDATTHSQQVKATLLDDAGNPVHLPILFTANLSTADEVAYDPANCTILKGVTTVQGALDKLCAAAGQFPGIHVKAVQVREPSGTQLLRNDTVIPVDELMRGLFIVCDQAILPATVSQPTCFLTLNIPFPGTIEEMRALNLSELPGLGYRPLILRSVAEVGSQGQAPIIAVRPATSAIIAYLQQVFTNILEFKLDPRILTRLTLKGKFIWAADNPDLYLNGDAFGVRGANATSTDIKLPTADTTRGGDFEMWFWLGYPRVGASPATVNFGNVLVGTKSAAQTITIANNGSARLDVAAMNIDNAQFQLLSQPTLSVQPGQQAPISVQFSPTALGNVAGTLTITSNSLAQPSTTVALAGTGFRPAPPVPVPPGPVRPG